MKFEIFKGKNGKDFYFRGRSSNGQIILSSEAYTTKASAEHTVKSIMEKAASAEIVDLTKEEK